MKKLKQAASLLMAALLVFGMVYFAPASRTHAAESYIAATYSANLLIETQGETSLYSAPTADSDLIPYTLHAGTVLTAQALHESTAGGYWYEVAYEDTTLYIDATACAMTEHLTGDVTISDAVSPASIAYGKSFPLWGNVHSTYNNLGTICAAMYHGSDLTAEPAIKSADEANGKSYSIRKNPVDQNLKFGTLDAGVYTYVLTAQAISHYIDSTGALVTSTKTVELQNQPCVITDRNNPNPKQGFGIDVSSWNGQIDWVKVAADGVDFAILQIGQGTTLDSTFLANAQGCIDNGIPFGISLYSRAKSPEDSIAEAQFVLDTLEANNLKCALPIWLDMEEPVHKNMSAEDRIATVRGFCDTIRAAGFQPGLYSFLSWFNNYFTDAYYNTLPKWISQVSSSNTYNGGTWMWQYSWAGRISGISGDVNCNCYYAEIPQPITEPTLTLGAPSVSFEGQIQYNIYFQLENADEIPLSDMGLITWDSPMADGTIDNAQHIIPGAVTDGQQFMVHSQGIPAKNMADTIYFKVYIKLEDGSYLYTDLKGYNAQVYAESKLATSTDENLRRLCVALLNYGTAAQNHFSYKPDALMNTNVTAEQQALIAAYDDAFVAPLVQVDTNKVGEFVYNAEGYATRRPSVSFDGAFTINYYFTTSFVPEGDVTLYYWTLEDYHSADVLTADNATGSMNMAMTDIANQYWAGISDIPAKLIDQTVFVTAVYTTGGVQYSTGVLSYSVGNYCQNMAHFGDSSSALCQAAAMYGYYAKEYLNSL